jgi:thioester reductase-like protein
LSSTSDEEFLMNAAARPQPRKRHLAPSKKAASVLRRVTDAPPPAREVLLTGFPGFIGRRLLRELLQDEPQSRVTALVEERTAASAQRFLEELPAEAAARVTVLTGDVVSMDLGLSGEEFQAITGRVTHIFHLAAIHKLKIDQTQADLVNVGGTRSVLELARECRHLRRLVHFSSCYVSGDRIGVISEEELSCGQQFRNSYEATKYKAEVLCRAAMTDLPITVIRPSIVVGDSETGEIDRLDGIYQVGVLVAVSPVYVPLPLPGMAWRR